MAVIKRPQHNMKLAQVLNNMLQCGSLVDVTIYCDDGQVNAHKLVLAASSTYFRNLFSRMTNAFHYPIIVLREMPIIDLKTIIQFIYHGEVNVPQNRVDSLMRCANYLQIDGMASSANSLNAILASSSVATANMSHQAAILTSAAVAHPGSSATNNTTLNNNQSTLSTMNNSTTNKLHPQYPPMATTQSSGPQVQTNYKPRGGHGSRSSHSNSNNNNNNNTNHNHHSTTSSGTSDHTNSNIGKPKHPCPVCLKTFTHGFTLKRHMKLHSQARMTIYCDVCSKSYSCKDSFMRHKKSSGHLQHAEFHHRPIDLN